MLSRPEMDGMLWHGPDDAVARPHAGEPGSARGLAFSRPAARDQQRALALGDEALDLRAQGDVAIGFEGRGDAGRIDLHAREPLRSWDRFGIIPSTGSWSCSAASIGVRMTSRRDSCISARPVPAI